MKVRITPSAYGFGKIWTLECYGKSFWLGQDAKVCHRSLGMTPQQVIQAIGTAEIETESGNRKLARLLTKSFGITRNNVNQFQAWSFSAE
jgi:hypothetical protein